MRDMDRREFCRLAAGWLLVAGTGGLTGCGRLLRWSESQSRTTPGEPSSSGASTSSTASTDGSTTTTSSQVSATTTTASGPKAPDLAVVRGGSPDALVRRAVEGLGGIERFVKRDARVVLKPNVLTGRAPEYAVTTNPILLAALIQMCFEAGAREVTVLDHPTSSARAAFRESGIAQAVAEAGGDLKYLSDRNFEQVEIPEGELVTSWPLVTDVLEADTFINVPIAKVHGLSRVTLAMKNLMGIMGGSRGQIHIDFPTKIVDVNTRVKPHLVILDAYRMLMRNGPTGGNLDDVQLTKTVVAGTSQVAVDAYGSTLFGLAPTDLAFLVEADRRGLGQIDLDTMDILQSDI